MVKRLTVREAPGPHLLLAGGFPLPQDVNSPVDQEQRLIQCRINRR
jgi:hypothetical protein